MKRNVRFLSFVLSAVAVLALPACGGTSFDPVVDEAGGILLLTDQGGGDKRVLSYNMEVGQIDRMSMTLDFDVSQEIGGESAAVDSPSIEVEMELEVTSLNLAGEYEIRSRYTGFTLGDDGDQSLRAAYLAGFEGLVGSEFTMTMTPSGVVLAANSDSAAIQDPAIESTVDQVVDQLGGLIPPLPAEPVGVGSTWSYKSKSVLNGVTSRAETTFTVLSVDGDSVQLRIETEDQTAPQSMDPSFLPPGTKAELTSSSGGGSGEVLIDLSSPVPAGSSDADFTQELLATFGGRELAMTQKLSISITTARR